MPTILLTGFEPFGDNTINPSQQIVERLHGETISSAQVIGLTLPVRMGEDVDRITAAIAEYKPLAVLSLGLAAGATCLEVERFAINLRLSEPGDPSQPLEPNGAQCCIVPDGMCALFATLDSERITAAIREKAQIPARAHGYAGSYACNHVFFQTLHYAVQWDLRYKAGFIHLPLSSEQAISENRLHLPSLPLESMISGIKAAIDEALS